MGKFSTTTQNADTNRLPWRMSVVLRLSPPLVWQSLLLYIATLLLARGVSVSAISIAKIQVCQNKHCCRRFRGQSTLPQILMDILSVTTDQQGQQQHDDDTEQTNNGRELYVESTGCLSLCDEGPNIKVFFDSDDNVHNAPKDLLLSGLLDSKTIIASLEQALQKTFPVKLKAAIQVLEDGQQGTTLTMNDAPLNV
jgi:hypothetical protein